MSVAASISFKVHVIDLIKLQNQLIRTKELLEQEPALAPFASALSEVIKNAERLQAGDRMPRTLSSTVKATIPSRAAAHRIIQALAGVCELHGDEPRDLQRAVQGIYGNLFDAVLFAVVDQFPDLMRDDSVGPPH